MSACVRIVYVSVCEQCCKLCNSSIPFKVDNEKLRDAIMFGGVCEFLRKNVVSIVILSAFCHT